MCKQAMGASQQLGTSCLLHGNKGPGAARMSKHAKPTVPASRAASSEKMMQPWYRQAKETKCGEMEGRTS
jgi:hypothetical protein